MTLEEYVKKSQEIFKEYQSKLEKLREEYVIFNKKFNVGDFVYNTTGLIKVEHVTYEIDRDDNIIIIYIGHRYKNQNNVISRTKEVKMTSMREENLKSLKNN